MERLIGFYVEKSNLDFIIITYKCMEQEFSYTDKNIPFGRTKDTPSINYILALDIDKKIIQIPFLHHRISIQDLISTYWKISSNRQKFEGKACFRVLKGKFKREIAQGKKMLLSFGFSTNDVCFRIEDSSHPEQGFSDVSNILNQEDEKQLLGQQQMLELTFILRGKAIKHKVGCKITVESLKKNLVANIPELQKIPNQSLQLQCSGAILLNQHFLSKLDLAGKQIGIYVKRKDNFNCYRANTMILLPDMKEREISQLKKGERILTFNRQTMKPEESAIMQISETIINQMVVIKLKNGAKIESTPNNLLLCEDGLFRLAKSKDQKEISLKEGDIVKLYNKKTIEIISIEVELIPPQPFYSINTDINKNIILSNGIVSHYQMVKIKSPDGLIQSIDVCPSDQFSQIKEKVQQIYHISSVHQRLLYCGKKFNDDETLLDKNICNEAIFVLSKLEFNKSFNLLSPQSLILLEGQQTKKVQELTKQDKLQFVQCETLKLSKQGKPNSKVTAVVVDQFFIFYLQEEMIKVSAQTYLLLRDNECILARDLYNKIKNGHHRNMPKLKSIEQQDKLIIKAQLVKNKSTFYKIQTDAPSIISHGVIIPNSIVYINSQKIEKPNKNICLFIEKHFTISDIKKIIDKKEHLSFQQENLIFNGQQLLDSDTLLMKKIQNQHLLLARQPAKKYYSSIFEEEEQKIEAIQDKNIVFQFPDGEKYQFKYLVFKDWTIKSLLKLYTNTQDPSFFLLFAEIIIFSNEKLSKIEQSASFKETNVTALVIKNQKLSFISALGLKAQKIGNSSCIMFENEKMLSQIQQKSCIDLSKDEQISLLVNKAASSINQRVPRAEFGRQYFYLPFLCLTSKKYHKQILNLIKNFENLREQIEKKESLFTLIKDLYSNMNFLNNYYHICHYGIRNFKASMFLDKNHAFYWYNFTIAYKSKQNVAKELIGHSGTLFYIQSTSGKLISKFSVDPSKNQILFAPFSYFLVERVVAGEQMDEVWLTQVTAPITFKKNIILWVDDNPQNNFQQYNATLNTKPQLEILQVTSTAAAEKWIDQFGWLLYWKGLEFKLISDMGRWEWRENQKINNYEAGIDLLELMYKKKGYSTRTLIFCGNQKRAEQIAKKRNIPQSRCIISDIPIDLEKYLGIQGN